MAKLSELAELTAKVTGLDIRSVRETARRLREAGLIQTGTGGRYGGADMTARDAAALLTALLGAGDNRDVKRSPETVNLCWPMVIRKYTKADGTELQAVPGGYFGLAPEHTFGDALIALIEGMVRDGLLYPAPYHVVLRLEVAVNRSPWPSGQVRIWGGSDHLVTAHYVHPERLTGFPKGDAEGQRQRLIALDEMFGGRPGFYETERTVFRHVFNDLGNLLREPSR